MPHVLLLPLLPFASHNFAAAARRRQRTPVTGVLCSSARTACHLPLCRAAQTLQAVLQLVCRFGPAETQTSGASSQVDLQQQQRQAMSR
jgi:hypothetical protein